MTSKPSVLIADADESAISTIASLLEREGHAVSAARCAAEAARLLALNSFDLLITDPAMPGNTGLELVAAASLHAIPVILVTQTPTFQSAASALRMPVLAYLCKPIDAHEFLSETRRALAHKALADSILHLRQQLNQRLQDLTLLERALASRLADPAAMGEALLSVLMQATLNTMNGINAVSRRMPASNGHAPLAAPEASVPDANTQLARAAIQSAVDTLERTKSSFKSKELGQLRRELEAVLKRLGASPPL